MDEVKYNLHTKFAFPNTMLDEWKNIYNRTTFMYALVENKKVIAKIKKTITVFWDRRCIIFNKKYIINGNKTLFKCWSIKVRI